MSSFYAGIDLHSKDLLICAIDEKGAAMKEKKIKNNIDNVLGFLEPFGEDIVIAVESTINWYWLVDSLMDAGYVVKLAHPLALKHITQAKIKTDRRDAYKLANLTRLDALPESYIYPKELRPLRDLLRRRSDLVTEKTKWFATLRMQFMQYNVNTMSLSTLKHFGTEDFDMLKLPEALKMHAKMTMKRIELLTSQIKAIEEYLGSITVSDPRFKLLTDITGIGRVLGLTIYYEIGDISRFENVRHFSSYCRLVPSCHQSSGKSKKGKGSKQGNSYLKCAFMQAAMISTAYDKDIKAYRDRRANKHGGKNIVANSILAHKLGMGVFSVLRDGVPFDKKLLFN
jgi:transposase